MVVPKDTPGMWLGWLGLGLGSWVLSFGFWVLGFGFVIGLLCFACVCRYAGATCCQVAVALKVCQVCVCVCVSSV